MTSFHLPSPLPQIPKHFPPPPFHNLFPLPPPIRTWSSSHTTTICHSARHSESGRSAAGCRAASHAWGCVGVRNRKAGTPSRNRHERRGLKDRLCPPAPRLRLRVRPSVSCTRPSRGGLLERPCGARSGGNNVFSVSVFSSVGDLVDDSREGWKPVERGWKVLPI
jgi:hypothetical protein